MQVNQDEAAHRPPGRSRGHTQHPIRSVARVLAIAWAGFCVVAIVADVLDPQASAGLGPTEQAAMIGTSVLPLGALAALPWHWELTGGVVLVLAGAFPWLAGTIGLGQRPWDLSLGTLLLTGFFLGVLPLSAGGLCMVHACRVRSRRVAG
jgi:hypothetical protein